MWMRILQKAQPYDPPHWQIISSDWNNVENRPAHFLRPYRRAGRVATAGGTTKGSLVRIDEKRSGSVRALPAVAVVVLVLCTVCVFLPGGLFRFSWIKTVFALLACIAAMWVRPVGRLPRLLKVLVLAGAGCFVLATVLSPDPVQALVGRWPRYEGVVVLGAYLGSLWAGARVLPGSTGTHRALVTWAGVAALVLAVPAVLELAGFRPLGGGAGDRPGGLLGNATDEGAVGAMLLALLLPPAVRERRPLEVAGLAAAATTVAASGSRAAYAGAAVAVVIVGAISWRSWTGRQRRTVLVVSGAIGAALAAALAVPAVGARLLNGSTVEGRWLLWGESLRLAADHLLVGVGPSRFVDVLPAYHDTEWAAQVGTGFPPDAPHLWVLQAATSGGLLVLVPALGCAVVALVLGIRSIAGAGSPAEKAVQASLLGAVVAYGVVLLTAFTTPGTAPLAFFLVGGLVGQRLPVNRPKGPRNRASAVDVPHAPPVLVRWIAVLAAVAALAQAVPAAIAEWPMKAGTELVAQGKIVPADERFSSAAALRPWDADTPMLAAQAFAASASEGNTQAGEQAVRWARRALAQYPDSLESLLALAVGLNATHQEGDARAVLDRAIRAAPHNAELYTQRAIASFQQGDIASSLTDAQRAAELNPTRAEPWQLLADIYERTGNTPEAQTARQNAQARR